MWYMSRGKCECIGHTHVRARAHDADRFHDQCLCTLKLIQGSRCSTTPMAAEAAAARGGNPLLILMMSSLTLQPLPSPLELRSNGAAKKGRALDWRMCSILGRVRVGANNKKPPLLRNQHRAPSIFCAYSPPLDSIYRV